MSFLKPIGYTNNKYESSRSELALEIQGTTQMEAGNNKQAIEIFNNAINQYPQNPYFYYLRGFSKENLNKYTEAISDYEQYLNINLNHYNAFFRIALCYQHLKSFNKSLEYYDLAINHFEEFKTLAQSLQDKLNKKDDINGNYYSIPKENIFGNRANAKMNLDNWESALNDCEQAISINPEYPNPYFLKGIYYYHQDRKEESKKELNKAAELGFEQADKVLRNLYGEDNTNELFYSKVKEYAESPEARKKNGGVQMRVQYKNDLQSALYQNESVDYSTLETLSIRYSKTIWAELENVIGALDDFNKAFICYEVSKAIESIYPEIDQQSFWKKTLQNAIKD